MGDESVIWRHVRHLNVSADCVVRLPFSPSATNHKEQPPGVVGMGTAAVNLSKRQEALGDLPPAPPVRDNRTGLLTVEDQDNRTALLTVEEPLHRERKFILFESSLRELLANCSVCGQAVGNQNFSVMGTLVVVDGVCERQHKLHRRSQPLVRGSGTGARNFLLAAGMLYSGCGVAATIRCLKSIGVQTITERIFYNYQRTYFLPAVKQVHLLINI
ncbi:hypothetical protein MRX96_035377 [Rhipicephalus microplus]